MYPRLRGMAQSTAAAWRGLHLFPALSADGALPAGCHWDPPCTVHACVRLRCFVISCMRMSLIGHCSCHELDSSCMPYHATPCISCHACATNCHGFHAMHRITQRSCHITPCSYHELSCFMPHSCHECHARATNCHVSDLARGNAVLFSV